MHIQLRSIKPRSYQLEIADSASKKNTLVVLPTGSGKTLIGILVALNRLEKFPDSKILLMAPTRPLSNQHKETFKKITTIQDDEITVITGKIPPSKRADLYEQYKIIIATPQTIQNDLKCKRLNLQNFSLAIFDEAHRCVKEYAYPYVAKKYVLQSKYPLILGLTASPGATRERIDEICKNLFAKAVEIRTETEIEKYIQPLEKKFIYVKFPKEFEKIKILLEEMLKDVVCWLKEHNYIKTHKPTRKELLRLQERLGRRYTEGAKSYSLIWAMVKSAQAIKIEYAIELLETQTISLLYDYLKRLEKSRKRSDRTLIKDPRMREVIRDVEELHNKGVEHPKLIVTIKLIKKLVAENSKCKIILFANYRGMIDKLNKSLREEGLKTEILIGQAIKNGKGLTQKKQIQTIEKFAEGAFNILITSSIGEEGLDIAATDYAIFYEPVPSEIRMIQRRGRVGRQTAGKVIFLITKGTRDEAYYWSAFRKEKKMRRIIYKLKKRGIVTKESLLDWVK